MAHHHHHSHPAAGNYNRAFAIGVALNFAYICVEAGVGIWVGSLALLADAGHNLSDVLSLLLAWMASYLATIPPTRQRTYGWRSSTILAALVNGLLLLVALGGIGWEAIRRFSDPQPVDGSTVMWVAAVGVAINAATAMMFFGGRKSDLNLRGAYLHMAADAAISLGVVAAGAAIWMTGWIWVDPVTSLVIAAVILVGTWGLLRESADLILHAVPRHIDAAAVERYLRELPGVDAVHDLHIWAMSTTENALTAHLIRPSDGDGDEFLARASHGLRERFGICHVTIQLERGTGETDCPLGAPQTL